MTVATAKISCGVRELTGLSRPPKELINQVMKAKGSPAMFEDFIHVVFSDRVDNTNQYGTKLANRIKKEKLGTLLVTHPRKNPNSGHEIQTWLWSVNWKRVRDFTK